MKKFQVYDSNGFAMNIMAYSASEARHLAEVEHGILPTFVIPYFI